jgi:hypothetical protein
MGLDSRGLPMSLQLAARPGSDMAVLQIADCFERGGSHLLPEVPLDDSPLVQVPDPDAGRTSLPPEQLAVLSDLLRPLGISPGPLDLTAMAALLRGLL